MERLTVASSMGSGGGQRILRMSATRTKENPSCVHLGQPESRDFAAP